MKEQREGRKCRGGGMVKWSIAASDESTTTKNVNN